MMHPYTTDRSWLGEICVFITTIALVGLANLAATAVAEEPQWWMTVISFGVPFVSVRWVTKRYAWRFALFRRLRLVAVPNLGGQWSGYLCSSYSGFSDQQPITVQIVQRWSELSIILDTQTSHSWSTSAILRTAGLPEAELTYTYINEPKAATDGAMHAHRGTATLRVEGDKLIGEYYTGRDRGAFGEIVIRRV